MKRKVKRKFWSVFVLSACLIIMIQIGNYRAASEPVNTPTLPPVYNSTASSEVKIAQPKEQQKHQNETQHTELQENQQNESEKKAEEPDIMPARNPVRAQPGRDKYQVEVNIAQQKVFVEKNGVPIRTMTCSTGLPGKETPLGTFKINQYYGLNFYNHKYQEGANYWVGFKKAVYLFHSVPVDKQGNMIEAEADKLGTPASHGCIRMSMKDAFWFYETVPAGTEVTIH